MQNKGQKKLIELTKAFEKNLPKRLRELEALWLDLQHQFDSNKLFVFFRAVHTLGGTAGTYGFMGLRHEARDLCVYLDQLSDHRTLNATHISEISHLLERMKSSIHRTKYLEMGTVEYFNKLAYSKNFFYLVKKTDEFHTQLQQNLKDLGYQLILIKSVHEFREMLESHVPAVILMDEPYLEDPNIKVLIDFRSKYKVPLIFISEHQDLETRLKSCHLDVTLFFSQPLDVSLLASKLTQQFIMPSTHDYRILIVDDSVPIAEYCAMILRENGMYCEILTDAKHLMNKLEELKPNLLILDLYLPTLSGFDLAKVIRQDERFLSLPIIFISTEDDRVKQLAILNGCGADDFLTKPVLPQNLIAAVKARIQRAMMLNNFIIHDSLTNLLNHANILKQLEHELLRAERSHESLSIAMIDLDHFKEINDKYGHPFGNIALSKISEMLSKSIRRTDFIGRYGGDEFLIIFPNTDKKAAFALCDNLRQLINHKKLLIQEKKVNVTVSIGIAIFPEHPSIRNLIATVDNTLYQSKTLGRNRVSM